VLVEILTKYNGCNTAITCGSLSNVGSNFSPNIMAAITGLNFAKILQVLVVILILII
jgi:hypothetical protein